MIRACGPARALPDVNGALRALSTPSRGADRHAGLRLHPFCGSSVLGLQLWRDRCLITVRERVAFLARILGRDGVIDRDRLRTRGGELELVGGP